MENMSIKVIETKLGDVEYSTVGEGTPILFLHGGHSNCHDTLSHKGFDLEKFQLITPSRPGYGRTTLKNNKTPEQAADLFTELLNYLALEKVIVYGISAGGLTAIELASNYSNRVSRLVLASTISKEWLDKNSRTYRIARTMFNPIIENLTWGAVRFFSFLFPQIIARSFFSQFSAKPMHKLNSDDVKELLKTLKHYSSGEGFLNDIDQNIEEDVINRIECPTLIIHSRNDSSVSIDHPEHSNRMIKLSTLEILDNEWGHLFWIGQDSQESIAITMKFIEE